MQYLVHISPARSWAGRSDTLGAARASSRLQPEERLNRLTGSTRTYDCVGHRTATATIEIVHDKQLMCVSFHYTARYRFLVNSYRAVGRPNT